MFKNIKTSYREFINESKILSYDDMDLDFFTRTKLVGRWFSSVDDAKEYLKSVIDDSENKTIDDYIISKDEKDSSLKPYRIFPKPSDTDLKRNDASIFIKKHGIISSPNLRYLTYPLYAYVEYKHIDELKKLNVKYEFKPIEKIDFSGVLSRVLKENDIANTITNNTIKLYNERDLDKSDIKNIKHKIEKTLDKFNETIGTNFYISKTITNKTNDTVKKQLLNKLDDKNYNPNTEFDSLYSSVSFVLNRGEENEFLAVVEMETLEKPMMNK